MSFPRLTAIISCQVFAGSEITGLEHWRSSFTLKEGERLQIHGIQEYIDVL